ncbi:unnamed protein product [Closterium sp. NIES-64]|nr:unnamed protein product [Closterium sp. NIES-64]
MKQLFQLDGTTDISNVTILLPSLDALYAASENYPKHDNATRKFDQAIADALTLMYNAAMYPGDSKWDIGTNISTAVDKAMLDIWKFQIAKQYIPFEVAKQKYSSIGGHWELPTMQGQPLWMSYHPVYHGSWNYSGMSPQQKASLSLPRSKIIKEYGYVVDDGTPYATTSVENQVLVDDPTSEVVVYRSDHVLMPYNVDALGAYAGATASILHLLVSISLPLIAFLIL